MIYNKDVSTFIGGTYYYSKRVPIAQGDVLLVPVDDVKPENMAIEGFLPGALVFALGEKTGHMHAVYTDDTDVAVIEGTEGVFRKQSPANKPKPARRDNLVKFKVLNNRELTINGKSAGIKDNVIFGFNVKEEPVPFTHEEHDTHMLLPGHWVALSQHELHHNEMVPVQD